VLLVQQQHAADSLLDLQRCLSDLVMPGLVTGVIAARLFRDSAASRQLWTRNVSASFPRRYNCSIRFSFPNHS
ncbi:hypothetical protein AB4Y43_38680, partial [Paraburkholderia sp. BR10872]|uniref:hypothetical protein n=1 Tax=Paraburkholderia sp. BR10872 TaxID=3236989 RepID=UPI0034D1E6C1